MSTIKNIYKFTFFILMHLLITNSINASNYPFDIPATVKIPEWVKKANWDSPNIHQIDSLIKIYKFKVEESNINEEPYLIAYTRWKINNLQFIKNDGSIVIDLNERTKQLENAINSQFLNKQKVDNSLKQTADWKPLGPIETFWSSSNGKACEQVNVYNLAIAPSNPNTLFCSSETGILFKSTNKGQNWISVSDALTAISVNSIAFDPHNENIVYCNAQYTGLLKTTDGGKSWNILSNYKGNADGGEKIEINPETGRLLIIGARNIYYSDNAGANWTEAAGSAISGYYYDLVIYPLDKNLVYATGRTNKNELLILKSSNAGESFTQISINNNTIENTGSKFGISISNPNTIYCMALGNTTGPKLLKSIDAGLTWNIIASSTNTSLGGGNGTVGLHMSNGQGFYDFDIVVDPYNHNNLIAGTTSIYKSTDGGLNFYPIAGYAGGNFNVHVDLQSAKTLGKDTYLTSDGGITHSSDFFSDPKNCTILNNGLTGSDFWGFGQGWDEDIVAGGRYHNGDAVVFDKHGSGNSMALGGGESATGHVFHGYKSTVGFNDLGTFQIPEKMSDKVTRAEINNTLWPQDDYYGLFSSELVVDPRYSNIFYLGKDSSLWKSVNRGTSYIALKSFEKNNTVWRFEVSRSNPDYIYVCTRNGVYKTTNAGESWKKLTLPVAFNYYNSDIAINPKNENEIFLCMASNPAAEKVIYSTNGGDSWKNITGKSLNNKSVAYLQYHGGTNGGIYAITSSDYITKVFYKDHSMSEWVDYSNGLPPNFFARIGGQIFYRDNKLRLAGNRGFWESTLYESGKPVAQPMSDKKYISCSLDTVRFFDYSMLNYKNAKWSWSFPGASWISDTNTRYPRVLYPTIGNYDVTLTVTNEFGQSDTKTIKEMIQFTSNNCSPDSIAGKCLVLKGNYQTVNLGKVNINSNTFTISCWIKPNGKQKSFSQILSHYACPGSENYGLGLGFTFSGYTPNLNLCYTDDLVNYGNYSGLICDTNKWNHVALVYFPDSVLIYLNGKPARVNSKKMPVLNLSLSPFYINADIHNQGGNYIGLIDEIKFYNYTLSQDEIREKMHLINQDALKETGLMKYYQFNNYDALSQSVYDVVAGFRSDLAIDNIVTSSAPVSKGTSYKFNKISNGENSFKQGDIDIYYSENSIKPDGEVFAFHLSSSPDISPVDKSLLSEYFIINHYGKSNNFDKPDSIRFRNLNLDSPNYLQGNFSLINRGSFDFGPTWSSELDSSFSFTYNKKSSSILWKKLNKLQSFGQFGIINKNEVYTSIHQDLIEGNKSINFSNIYPNPSEDWISLDINSNIEQNLIFNICNINGSTLISFNQYLKFGLNIILINIKALNSGEYILNTLDSKNQRYSIKFIKI